MRDRILEILNAVRPDVDFENENALISDNILESFDIIELIGEINDEFDIEITPKYLTEQNFNSLDAICSLVEELQQEE